jgi:mycofactocin precursor
VPILSIVARRTRPVIPGVIADRGSIMPETAVNEQVVTAVPAPETTPEAPLEIADLLVEDVSIDGMCGVY